MSSIKNPTLRRRTKELTECAEDAIECQRLAYELKDIGRLIECMAIHMQDLQRKVDSQAEHIKMLNEKLTADTPQTECRTCKWAEASWTSHYCDDCKAHNKYEPNNTPQTDCSRR